MTERAGGGRLIMILMMIPMVESFKSVFETLNQERSVLRTLSCAVCTESMSSPVGGHVKQTRWFDLIICPASRLTTHWLDQDRRLADLTTQSPSGIGIPRLTLTFR